MEIPIIEGEDQDLKGDVSLSPFPITSLFQIIHQYGFFVCKLCRGISYYWNLAPFSR